MRRFDQLIHAVASAQYPHRAGGVGLRIGGRAVRHNARQRGDHFRPRRDVGIDRLVVGVRELGFQRVAGDAQGAGDAVLHIAGKVEVDQAVGGQHFHAHIAVAGGQDQRVEAAAGADAGELADHLRAHFRVGIAQQFHHFGDGPRATLGQFADVLRLDGLLGCQWRQHCSQGAHHSIHAHVSMLAWFCGWAAVKNSRRPNVFTT